MVKRIQQRPWGLTHLLISRREALIAFKAMLVPRDASEITSFTSLLCDEEFLDILQKYKRLNGLGAQIAQIAPELPMKLEFDTGPQEKPLDIKMVQQFDSDILEAYEKYQELAEEIQQTNSVFDPHQFNYEDPLSGLESIVFGAKLCKLSEIFVERLKSEAPFADAPDDDELNRLLLALATMMNPETRNARRLLNNWALRSINSST